jgi:hypothetical protein
VTVGAVERKEEDMRRLSIIVIAVVAVMAASAGSALAVGLPSLLNIKSPQAITGTASGTIELQTLGGTTLKCAGSSMEASLTTDNSGTDKVTLTGCKSTGMIEAACTTKGSASGTILSTGPLKIVHDVTETGSTYAILFELPAASPTTFECTSLVKVSVSGTVICLILEPTVEKESHIFVCKNNKTIGDPGETSYWYEMVIGTASLLMSLNGGKAESSAEVGSATFITNGSPKAVVMN